MRWVRGEGVQGRKVKDSLKLYSFSPSIRYYTHIRYLNERFFDKSILKQILWFKITQDLEHAWCYTHSSNLKPTVELQNFVFDISEDYGYSQPYSNVLLIVAYSPIPKGMGPWQVPNSAYEDAVCYFTWEDRLSTHTFEYLWDDGD